jgi:hypothetical protein
MEDVKVGKSRTSILGKVNPSRTAVAAYAEGIHQLGHRERRSDNERTVMSALLFPRPY